MDDFDSTATPGSVRGSPTSDGKNESQYYDVDGTLLPTTMDCLAQFLSQRGFKLRGDIREFFCSIPHEDYFRVLVDDSRKHPAVKDFIPYMMKAYDIHPEEGWKFLDDDELEDVMDFVMYLMGIPLTNDEASDHEWGDDWGPTWEQPPVNPDQPNDQQLDQPEAVEENGEWGDEWDPSWNQPPVNPEKPDDPENGEWGDEWGPSWNQPLVNPEQRDDQQLDQPGALEETGEWGDEGGPSWNQPLVNPEQLDQPGALEEIGEWGDEWGPSWNQPLVNPEQRDDQQLDQPGALEETGKWGDEWGPSWNQPLVNPEQCDDQQLDQPGALEETGEWGDEWGPSWNQPLVNPEQLDQPGALEEIGEWGDEWGPSWNQPLVNPEKPEQLEPENGGWGDEWDPSCDQQPYQPEASEENWKGDEWERSWKEQHEYGEWGDEWDPLWNQPPVNPDKPDDQQFEPANGEWCDEWGPSQNTPSVNPEQPEDQQFDQPGALEENGEWGDEWGCDDARQSVATQHEQRNLLGSIKYSKNWPDELAKFMLSSGHDWKCCYVIGGGFLLQFVDCGRLNHEPSKSQFPLFVYSMLSGHESPASTLYDDDDSDCYIADKPVFPDNQLGDSCLYPNGDDVLFYGVHEDGWEPDPLTSDGHEPRNQNETRDYDSTWTTSSSPACAWESSCQTEGSLVGSSHEWWGFDTTGWDFQDEWDSEGGGEKGTCPEEFCIDQFVAEMENALECSGDPTTKHSPLNEFALNYRNPV